MSYGFLDRWFDRVVALEREYFLSREIRNRLARRDQTALAFVRADVTNSGDQAAFLGIMELAGRSGYELSCSDAAPWLRRRKEKGQTLPALLIGGGGLLQPTFENFWDCVLSCGAPFALFGVGENIHEPDRPKMSSNTLQRIARQAVGLHVRDDLTRDTLERAGGHCSVGICPSVNLIHDMCSKFQVTKDSSLLHVIHRPDLRHAEIDEISLTRRVRDVADKLGLTYHELHHDSGFSSRMIAAYREASVVVSSRLHGCIFSYAVGTPFVALDCDEKIAAFIATHAKGSALLGKADLSLERIMEAIRACTGSPPPSVQLGGLNSNREKMRDIISLLID